MTSLILPPAPVARLLRSERCENCAAVALQPDGVSLQCQLNPPTVAFAHAKNPQTGQMAVQTLAGYPPVNAETWCRQWKSKIQGVHE